MDISAENLTETELKANFAFWIEKWNPLSEPSQQLNQIVTAILCSHTFGQAKRWGDGEDEVRYPYRDVLFKDKSLLSDAHRAQGNMFLHHEMRRKMALAKPVGLDKYVFAYFGIHDPRYAADKLMDAVPAFGVFLKKDLEKFPYCNATRRDLGSPESVNEKWREFLFPADARSYVAFQVANDPRHNSDFWHYWGSDTLWSDPIYNGRESWIWKIEFHYLDSVPAEKFAAVLWPVSTQFSDSGDRDDSGANTEIELFRKYYPDGKVIPYRWSARNFVSSFIEASYLSILYFIKHGIFPESAEIAQEDFRNDT